ncbi:MAG: copper resistance protein CopC [Nitrospirae bacterium]|nr:copper resistance protein CopC [Nitrospirota bacterium]
MTGVLLGLLLFLPWDAFAHVFPDHSDPRVGSEIKDAPSSVRIWFDGQLEPIFSTLQVFDSSGKEVTHQDARVNEKDTAILEVSIPHLPPGKYQVNWKALARDGHLTEGKFYFTIK